MESLNNKSTPNTLRGLFKSWQKLSLLLLVFAIISVIWASVQLVQFASHGKSDISVMLRTAALLKKGAGGEIYAENDERTNWPRCIPPAGMVFFQPLTLVSPTVAGIIWALINLGLLAGSVFALFQIFKNLDHKKSVYLNIFPWALAILLYLSIGSLQVGQFSVLFIACWIFYLYAASKKNFFWEGISLSIPSSIKLYPLLMLASPLFSRKSRIIKFICFFLFGIFITSFLIPVFFYRARTLDLSKSFFTHTILSSEGRVARYQDLKYSSFSDQGLDVVLLRYLSYVPEFHSHFPRLPHLFLERQIVLILANIIRVVVLFISTFVAFHWVRHVKNIPFYSTMMMAALWSSTLYLILPGVKARYAVYTFIGFLPLLEAAELARINFNWKKFTAFCSLIVFCFLLILQAMPDLLRVLGIGLVGAFALWTANVFLLIRYKLTNQKSM